MGQTGGTPSGGGPPSVTTLPDERHPVLFGPVVSRESQPYFQAYVDKFKFKKGA